MSEVWGPRGAVGFWKRVGHEWGHVEFMWDVYLAIEFRAIADRLVVLVALFCF